VWPLLRRGLLADRDARWPSMDVLLAALVDARSARRARRRGVLVGAALLAGAIAVAVWRPTSADVDECDATRQRLAGLDVAGLEPRFSAAGLDDAVVGWRAALAELALVQQNLGAELEATCAVDAPSRRGCVERRVDALVAAHALLRDGAPAALGNAAEVVRVVSSAPRCVDAPEAVVLPPAVALELDHIRLLEASGDYARAVAAAEALAAQEPDEPTARAAIALRLGSIRERLGEADVADVQWREAYFDASAAGAQELAAEAALDLVFLHGLRTGDLAQAREWARNAEIAIARAALGDRMRAQLARHMGTALRSTGEREAALEQHQRAVELAEGLDPVDEDLLAMAYEDLGTTLASLARYDDALARLDAAARLTDRVLPARHPDRTIIALNLGIVSKNAERFAEAQHHLSAARALAAAVLPVSHPRRGSIALALAEVRRRAGALDEAEDLLREALGRAVADRGTAVPSNPVIDLGLAEIDLARGRPEAALAVVERVRGQLPPSPNAMFELVHAAALAALGERVEADAAFARARAASVRGDRLWLAAAVAAIGQRAAIDRSRARQLLGVVRAELGERDLPPHSAAEL
ncbi:MAG: tetratricopeptide repeat protein, partial [Myxococcales bacterium]|nr:tetratricopeptide repeat protein [Myxococcales bacterium]